MKRCILGIGTAMASALAVAIALVIAFVVTRPTEARLRADCLHGDSAEACALLGEHLQRGVFRARFADEPALVLGLACERGATRACDRAEALSTTAWPDYEDFEVDIGCMLRDNAFACEESAEAFEEDLRDHARAHDRASRGLAIHERRCEAGDAEACAGAARLLERDPRAKDRDARACALGRAASCEALGDEATSQGEAMRWYATGCDRGAPHACLALAKAKEAAGAPDTRASYERACDRHVQDACDWLAVALD